MRQSQPNTSATDAANAAAECIKSAQRARSARRGHEATWREAFDYGAPERGAGIDSDETYDAGTDQTKRARVLSSVTAEAAENLAANLQGGAVPSNTRWFDLAVDGADDFGKRWLSDAAQFVWANIHASNFDAEAFDAMTDMVHAGWFALYIEEAQGGGYQFETWPMSQVFVESSKSGGRVDIVYRCYKMTADQAAAKYGIDALSERTRDLVMDGKGDTMVAFVHRIQPRKVWMPGALLSKHFPIESLVVEEATRHTVRESGYHEMPVVVPRWSRMPRSAYAVGPVCSALPDVRMLNKLRNNEIQATDLAVAGMWIAEDDGVLNPKTIKVGPRRVIVANSVDSMKELKSGSDFNVAFTAEDRLERQIRRKLYADQLQAQDGPQMTATEVHVRVALIRQLLAPVFGRLQAEFLQPLIERCFGIAYRAGVLGMAPESIAGRSFHVRYVSPMARAQKLEEVHAIQQYGEFIGAQVAAGFATAADNYDPDEASRAVADGLGVPQRVVPDKRSVQALRDARKQDAQNQQQQAMQQQATTSVTDAMAKRMAQAA